jgi:replicative DNA helicase
MAPQLEDKQDVLWFNNEEAGRKVRDRVYQAAIGWTSEEIQDNKIGAVAEIKSAIGRMDRIKVYDKSIMSWQEIEEIIESSNPGLIIIDQLWKVKGFERSSFSESDKMVHLFGWGRSLAQTYAPLITVHQADGTAYGEPYLGMEQLYMSRIGIQGEIDAMIGLGRVYDAGRENTRFIHIAKNKLDGGPRSVKAERNGKYEIEVDFDRVRFNGVYKRP